MSADPTPSPRFVAVDLETTGCDPLRDRIVELAMLEVDANLNPGTPYSQRFNPGIPILQDAWLRHGIRDQDVQNEPSFKDRAAEIQDFLGDAILIAYNGVRFDLPLLHKELTRAGQPGLPDRPVIDPFLLFLEEVPHTLTGAVRHYLRRDHPHAHRALADAQAAVEVLRVQRATRYREFPRVEGLVHKDNHGWLDASRYFYLEGGVVFIGFGKFRDRPAKDHPDYLEWIMRRDFASDTKRVAEGVLRSLEEAEA